MNNKWTTLEDQTDQANKAVSDILEHSPSHTSSHARRNKFVAIAMAGVGVLLIGLGVYPFVVDSQNAGLKADVSEVTVFDPNDSGSSDQASANEFESFADSSSNADFLPVENAGEDDLNSLFAQAETVDLSDSFSPEAEVVTLDQAPESENAEDDMSDDMEESVEVATDMDIEEMEMTEEVSDADASESEAGESDVPESEAGESDAPAEDTDEENAPEQPEMVADAAVYTMNTHTGTTDDEVVVVNASDAQEGNMEELHAAAPAMTETGPEAWMAFFLALGAAFALRRRRMVG